MPQFFKLSFWVFIVSTCFGASGSGASVEAKAVRQKPLIVASIRPLALLARQLVGDTADITVLIDGASSPHDFSLNIGQALMLKEAELLIWVAPQYETFLSKTKASSKSLSMAEVLLIAEPAVDAQGQGQDHAHDHEHSGWHLWLSSQKTLIFADALAARLQTASWVDQSQLALRLAQLKTEVAQAQTDIDAHLQPYQNQPFAAFHDAFGEFVDEHRLSQSLSLTRVPHQRIGAKQLVEHQSKLQHAACMLVDFSEKPVAQRYAKMFDLPLVDIDLLGASSELDSYAAYLKSIGISFQRCFTAKIPPLPSISR